MWSTWSGSSLSRLSTTRRASISGSAAGSRTSGTSSLATSTGTPAAPRERRSGGMDWRPDRTSTAISSHAMPSSRCARRSRSARCSASARSLSKVRTVTRPSPCSPTSAVGARNASRALSGMLPGSPIRPATPLRGGEQPRPEPAGGPQRHHLGRSTVGSREVGREVEDPAHLRASERVDRLVRVAHHHQVAAVTGDRPQQRHLAGVGVLVLVDEDVRVGRAQLVAMQRRLDRRAPDQVGVVDGTAPVEDREVLLQERAGRHELRQPVGLTQLLELLPVEPLLPGSGQHRVHLAREPAGPERVPEVVGPPDRLGMVLQQLTQHHVLLGRREQPERADVELGRRVAPDQAVGERVERRADARGHGAADPRGDAVAELLGRLAREGQRQDPVGVGALLDAADDRLDQRRGLAGAGPGQDEERPSVVVRDPLLLLVEDRRLTGE